MDYWVINGIGINTNDIRPHLNQGKLLDFLAEQLPDDEDVIKWVALREETGKCPAFDINDFFYGKPFANLADLLTFCDDTDTLTYDDDNEGSSYFYYPPSMPWELREDDPKTIEEVHQRIVAAVQKVTGLTADNIESMVDNEIYVVCAG